MAKRPSKSTDTVSGKSSKPRQPKAAAAPKRTTGPSTKAPVRKKATAARPAKGDAAKLQAAASSLYNTALEIVSDRLQPTLEQIRSLAQAVIGHEEKRARQKPRKSNNPAPSTSAGVPRAKGAKSALANPKKKA